MRAIRRAASVIGYLIGGMYLAAWTMLSFVSFGPLDFKIEFMGYMAGFWIVPLAVSAIVTPGSRLREFGLVLLAASVSAGILAFVVTVTSSDAEFLAMVPEAKAGPETLLDDPIRGLVLTVALGLTGWWIMRKSATPPLDRDKKLRGLS